MTEPIATVVRIASTPEQAKIFVAMLQAEGIPATVEGDSLADEVAVSRRLMNLGGTKVMVPSASLERAKEILDIGAIDAAELEAQALAADPDAAVVAPRAATVAPTIASTVAAPRRTPWLLIGCAGAAVLFLGLWLSEVDARADMRNPSIRYEPLREGLREVRRSDGKVIADYFDEDRDGSYERVVVYAEGGEQLLSIDSDHDLRYERYTENRGGLVYGWVDQDRDGTFDVCTVTDADGKKVQELRYVPMRGFVLQQY
ncbi:MAG: hypothetical protein H6838_07860 [Planctomycetes bacterium]|nr:hypothetical protein [Planctomycetota bacterium]MCB9885392.1 hypothetical protein [Planctomycetota bacterium]